MTRILLCALTIALVASAPHSAAAQRAKASKTNSIDIQYAEPQSAEHRQVLEGERPLQQVVEDTPRRADHDLRPFPQRLDLLAIADASVDHDAPEAGIGAESLRVLPHLAGQFPRRNEDERLRAGDGGVEPLQHRQEKGAGLAAARARLDDHILAVEQVRDRPRLDRHEHIGAGYIGLQAFRRILNHPKLRDKAFILETPVDEGGDHARNIETLKRLCRKSRTIITKLS